MEHSELRDTESRWNIGLGGDMPIGFGLSLAMNSKSMEAFAKMSEAQKQETMETMEKSRQMHTKEEMECFVNSLGKQKNSISQILEDLQIKYIDVE